MKRSRFTIKGSGNSLPVLRLTAAYAALSCAAITHAETVNFQDHVLPIFRDKCTNCHNPDKNKGGLDLTTYDATLRGSSGGEIVVPGDVDDSILYQVMTHAEEPVMPPKSSKAGDEQLAVVKAWLESGMRPTADGKAVKRKVSALAAMQMPTGDAIEVVMPESLSPGSAVSTPRGTAVPALAASPGSPLLAVAGQKQVLLYHTETRELIGAMDYPGGWPKSLKFVQGGRLLLASGGQAGRRGNIALWEVASGSLVADLGDELDELLTADLSPDRSRVLMGGQDRLVKLMSAADGEVLQRIKKHTDWVTAVGYSPDGVLFASADRAGGLMVWEAESGAEFYTLEGHKEPITRLAWRPDSNVLATASEDGSVKLWQMTSGKLGKTLKAHDGGVLSVAFTRDGRLVTAGRDKQVKLWAADGKLQKAFPAADQIQLAAVCDASGTTVIAADWAGVVRAYDVESGKASGEFPRP